MSQFKLSGSCALWTLLQIWIDIFT